MTPMIDSLVFYAPLIVSCRDLFVRPLFRNMLKNNLAVLMDDHKIIQTFTKVHQRNIAQQNTQDGSFGSRKEVFCVSWWNAWLDKNNVKNTQEINYYKEGVVGGRAVLYSKVKYDDIDWGIDVPWAFSVAFWSISRQFFSIQELLVVVVAYGCCILSQGNLCLGMLLLRSFLSLSWEKNLGLHTSPASRFRLWKLSVVITERFLVSNSQMPFWTILN